MKIMIQMVGTCSAAVLRVMPIFHHLEHSGIPGT